MIFDTLKRFSDFQGRSTRKEFWLFYLFFIVGYIVLMVIDLYLDLFSYEAEIGFFSGVFLFAMFIPLLSVQIRRLHDIDRTGFWILISIIPIIGAIVLLIFMCLKGSEGENRFGPENGQDLDFDARFNAESNLDEDSDSDSSNRLKKL